MSRKAPMAPMKKITAIVVVALVLLGYIFWAPLSVGIIAAAQGFDQEFINSPAFNPYLYDYSVIVYLVALPILALVYWRFFSINRSAQGMKTLLRHWTRPKQLLMLLMLFCVVWSVCQIVSMSEMALFPGIQDAFNEVFGDDLPRHYVVIYICVLGPICEELAFRGIAQHALMRARMPLWLVLALPAACFGYMHLIPYQMIYAFCMGLVAGWICYRTKSILPSIVVHILQNSISIIYDAVLPSENDPVFYVFLGVTVAVSVLLVVLLAKKRLKLEPAPTREVQALEAGTQPQEEPQAAGETF